MLPSSIRSTVPGLKAKYGSVYALDVTEFGLTVALDVVLIRAMSRAEFNNFSYNFSLDPVHAVKDLVDSCVISPINLDGAKAGIDEYICSAISLVSGFASEESLAQGVEDGRTHARSLEAAITIYICKAFPTFNPKDVDNMTLEEQMKYVGLAEQMLGKELPYAEYLNPTKPKKKKPNIPNHVWEDAAAAAPMGPPPPPSPQFEHSHGGSTEDEAVVVTPDNLARVMAETRDIFGGGS